MRALVAVGLLASAFAPLVAVLAVLQLPALGWWAWALLAGCLASVVLLLAVLRSLGGIQARPLHARQVRRADERVVAFTSSYVLPLVVAAFGPETPAKVVATVALVALMALIYVRAGLFHLNPTLALLGYRLYEVTATNGTVTMLLTTSRHLRQDATLHCRYLGDDVAIEGRVDGRRSGRAPAAESTDGEAT
ncbi:tetrahydromethanopterin S-methyltransferase subunit C [Kineosphaera limosa]|uniref:Uncharacterized protein n=1 Tax=Kineosphaera limosa NBRC 100340 TaxID=1184609 RepID=K6WBS7_9MICO|nr:hypothetical protein [Kineosphaera limosa]NYE01533.1 tetrahydromethanopterin S-methyltransferase subunit C [Kineosphaera limosa]GAB96690.1 hypothetical protein KILIM_045_00210 [Kineosphaera limosa NBRC 100340]